MISHIPDASDEELVLHARRGNNAAFDELVRRFRGAVIAVAEQTTGSRDCAEDVAQDAFLQAYRALPQLHDPQKFGHWLYVIARCRARRVGARDGRCTATDPIQLESLLHSRGDAPSCHPAEAMIRAAERQAVRTAFLELPAEHALVLRLYYFEGWRVRRIADHLRVPTTTVKWRLHRGRRLLQLLLTRGDQIETLALKAGGQGRDYDLAQLFTDQRCSPRDRPHPALPSTSPPLVGASRLVRQAGAIPALATSPKRRFRRSALRRQTPRGLSLTTFASAIGWKSGL
jgi:RNA polymerase sigma-70 factor, ECF subfamily